ncbi:hypothetical protein J4E93_009849 [Alternaria ventricosa]|uniref:uncharacterized protein n=1 Tax=Alternaria ventricosa TaxID=1187951 RepID=UPI0020C4BA7D|nr:uncharacterized protein J4E93_009849 [Alternaria ventricosa]KAI4638821.1 hypothetical protein J4E93_009849 [Alternaria ventricosa]
MTQLPREDWNPAVGPLESRAWTLQERLLARRFISFMPRGVTWACNESTVDEIGSHLKIEGQLHWLQLLSAYTKRSLTFPSDRTEALRGIAEDTNYAKKDHYIPEYGVWEKRLPLQLLWFRDLPDVKDGKTPNLPSWSWAATESSKKWLEGDMTGPYDTGYENVDKAEEMPTQLQITPAGNIHIVGHISTVHPVSEYVRDEFTAQDLKLEKLESIYHSPTKLDFHLLTRDIDGTYDKLVLGIARFDDDEKTSFTHACFLIKQNANSRRLVGGKMRPKSGLRRDFIDDVVYHTEQNTTCLYWALLLDSVDKSTFRRVGIATFLPIAYGALNVEVQEFDII